ncbi:MAG: VWA domain-containing protein, partial [Lachnospiraceae bacterium]
AGAGEDAVILVIDNSASMASLYDGDRTRLDAAKEYAADYVADLPNGTLIHVICCNKDTALAVAGGQDQVSAQDQIRKISQTVYEGNPSLSLGLVQSCAAQSESARIIFLTDTAFDQGDLEADVISFYKEGLNCSLDSVSFSRKNESGILQVLAVVSNYGSEDAEREINLYGINGDTGEEKLLSIQKIAVPSAGQQSVFFELSREETGGITCLRAQLQEADALAADNETWCVLSEDDRHDVLLVTKANLFLEKAFSNLPGVTLYRTADPETALTGSRSQNTAGGQDGQDGRDGAGTQSGQKNRGDQYDLYIFDQMVPDRLPESGACLFVNCDFEEIFRHTDTAQGVRLTLMESDAAAHISGKTFGVNETYVYETPSWAAPFLSIPGRTSRETAGFYGTWDGRKIGALGFDLHQTDFGLQAAFPIMISNLADQLLGSGLVDDTIFTAGQSIMLHGSSRGGSLILEQPDGSSREISADQAAGSYMEAGQTGLYKVSQLVEAGGEKVRSSRTFAVRFPAGESEVTPAATMENAKD